IFIPSFMILSSPVHSPARPVTVCYHIPRRIATTQFSPPHNRRLSRKTEKGLSQNKSGAG
ncbi:MAG: hypothetical protein II650_01715, partial [Clostridia bacterium]|nr:hypothetical protein [Clostridia bacterium]